MDLSISLAGANGDVITFDHQTWILSQGLRGFGIPTTKVRIQEAAVDGGIFRHTKRGIREVDLPIVVVGSDRNDTEGKLRRLSNILQNTSGPATLTATYDSGAVFTLQVYYTGGGETVFGEDANQTFAKWVVALQAPQPFWVYNAPQVFTVTAGNVGRGLLPRLSNLKLTSSQAVGTITVNNTLGDVPSYPIWKVYGPLDSLTVTTGSTGFVYSQPIALGDTLTIDTAAGTVVDAAGVNRYGNLAAAPKFFSLPPGTTSVNVFGSGATSATQISCTYYPRREVLH